MGKELEYSDSDSSNESLGLDEEQSDGSFSSDNLKLKSKLKKPSKHLKKSKVKEKKRKRKRMRKRRRSKSSSRSSSDSEDKWVERPQKPSVKRVLPPEEAPQDKLKKSKVDEQSVSVSAVPRKEDDDDEWMNFGNTLPTFSNTDKKSARQKQKEEERERSSIDNPGQYANELNPYWKDGGSGLPEEGQSQEKGSTDRMIGDGGLNYLRKAFVRAKEQAKEEGRSLEDVVSERWGSLQKFLSMLEDAEEKAKMREREDRYKGRSEQSSTSRFVRPRRDSDEEDDKHASRTHKREYSRDYRDRRARERESRSGWQKKRKSRSPDSDERLPSSSSSSRLKSEDRVNKIPERVSQNIGLPSATSVSDVKSRQPRARSPSSSPDSDKESLSEPKEPPKVLTDMEMNELGAKLLKAEMLGNNELVEELKAKISQAEAQRQEFIKGGGDLSKSQSVKVITKVVVDSSDSKGRRRKDKPTETHKDGQRVRYFPDDDKYSLQNMFQKEKLNTAADENALFARLAGKSSKTGVDYDIDDVFADKASSSKQASKEQEREIRDVFEQEKQYKKVIDNCAWCFDGTALEKHLILSVAEKCFLCVPPYQSLTEGHCLIVPMSHVSSATDLDEDVWSEMQRFRKALVQMFRESEQDMVIFETAMYLKRHPHMYLECVPMPKETGELAPIYFKKAIQECETEWSQNKKLVELRNRDVRRAIPKGLPYFSVDFGDDSCGFAHVVEDEKNFPRNFAHEIIGGMLELDHHLWRKQKKDDFKTQRNKVMEFLKSWASHDWTRESC